MTPSYSPLRADPRVQRLALGLARLGRVRERRHRAAEDADAARVRAQDQLAMALDQPRRDVAAADVVDALEDDDVRDARLRQRVAVEAGERVLAGAAHQHAVAGDAGVDDAERRHRRR